MASSRKTPVYACPPQTVFHDVTYGIASSRQELEAAYRLVHVAYTANGLMRPNRHGMRITPYDLLPTTDVFIATHKESLIYTMALVWDGPRGLPLEQVYSSEVDSLRSKNGASLAQVTSLASKQGYFSQRRMFNVFLQLVGLMFQSARARGVKQALIAVHPRHAGMYERFLGFQRMAAPRNYASVCNHPSVACLHDFARLDQTRYRAYDQVYGTTFQPWELVPQPMSAEDRAYFTATARECEQTLPAAA